MLPSPLTARRSALLQQKQRSKIMLFTASLRQWSEPLWITNYEQSGQQKVGELLSSIVSLFERIWAYVAMNLQLQFYLWASHTLWYNTKRLWVYYLAISNWTIVLWAQQAAACSGVHISVSRAFTSAPKLSSSNIICSLLSIDDWNNRINRLTPFVNE